MTNIRRYNIACENIALEFSEKFCDSYEYDWVSSDLGGVCCIGDIYLDVSDMAMVLKLDPTIDTFHEAYWEYIEKEGKVNLKNLIKYGVEQMRSVTKKNENK